jgi:hypothetical protein
MQGSQSLYTLGGVGQDLPYIVLKPGSGIASADRANHIYRTKYTQPSLSWEHMTHRCTLVVRVGNSGIVCC